MILKRFQFSCAVFAILMVGACTPTPYEGPSSSRQATYGSDGYKSSSKSGELSPEEAHRLAKAAVDPNRVNKKNAYVKTAEQSLRDQKERERVAMLERDADSAIVKNEFKGLKSSISRAGVSPAPTPQVKPRIAAAQSQPTRISTASVPAPSVKPLRASKAAPISYSSTKASGSFSAIHKIRTGEYANKTRLVFDMTAPTDFKYEIDSAQDLLLINLPRAQWNADLKSVFKNSRALKAYAAKPSKNGGTLVAVKLKGPSKVTGSAKLEKNASGYHRIYIDVTPI